MIVLDDLALEREQVMSLLNILPQCLFILASESRSLWGEGRVVPLSGLPKNDAVMLFVQELGREPLNNETSIIEQICLALNGHPFRILEMASLAREGKSLSEILKELQGDEPDLAATVLVVNSLDQPQKNIVGILGSLGGALVTLDHLRELADIPNIDASLKKLSTLGLIQTDGSKYGIASSIIKTLPQAINLTLWDDTVIKHFANWVVQNPAQGLLEDSLEALAKIIQKAGEKKDWQQVVRIGRALEKILILKKRWQAWADILDLLLRAARALGDRKLEGWVFHQLGSRAMCMGITETARGFLSQAFQIRKAIGDQAGMQLSQHNLNVLLKLFPIPETSGCRRWFTCGTIGAVGSAGIFILILLFTYFSPSSPSTTPPTDVPPIIITNTQFIEKETLTPTPTLIITPSITNTPEPQILYDFISEASNAAWSFGVNDPDGFYEYPIDFIKDPDGSSPEANANTNISPYAGWDRDPDLEDKSKESLVILAYPAGHSHVQGLYDLKQYLIQTDDQLVVKIGYKNVPTKIFSLLPDSDGVKFKVIFENSEVDIFKILLEEDEFNDRRTQTLVVELSSLAGFSGNFLLQVESHETYYNDFAVWMDAYLQRP